MLRALSLAFALLLPSACWAVVAPPHLTAILAADFDDKPLGQPIGVSGPSQGEPTAVDATRIGTEVVTANPGRALRITRLDTPDSTAAGSLRFGFLGNREVDRGPLGIRLLLTPAQLGSYALRTREAGASAVRWIDIELSAAGDIRRQVGSGPNTVVGSYQAGQALLFEFGGDFDAGTYRIDLNGETLDSGSFTPAARGVGQLLVSFLSGSANFGLSLELDDVLVEAASLALFANGFE